MAENGVWRTVGGRRIFIKDGQSLSDAMKQSGKFKSGSSMFKFDKPAQQNLKTYSDELKKEEATNYMKDQFKAFDQGKISSAELEKAKKDSGLSKEEIEKARDYVNARATENNERQTENTTGKATSQPVPKDKVDDNGYNLEKQASANTENNYKLRYNDAKERQEMTYKSNAYDDTEYAWARTEDYDTEGDWTIKNPITGKEEIVTGRKATQERLNEINSEIQRGKQRKNSEGITKFDKGSKIDKDELLKKINDRAEKDDKYGMLNKDPDTGIITPIKDAKYGEGEFYTAKEYVDKLYNDNVITKEERDYAKNLKKAYESEFGKKTSSMTYDFAKELEAGERKSLDMARDNLERAKRNGASVEAISDRTRILHEQELKVQSSERDTNKALAQKYKGTYDYLKSTTNMSNAEILEILKKMEKDNKK